jgi:Raf kinase inhibitor-like YbhB/YbcL family protein
VTAPNDPFYRLPEVPRFAVRSTDVVDGQPFAPPQLSGIFGVPGGKDRSPQLSWSGAPAATRSFAVTVYDPDAPTGAGFWHWVAADIPPDVTELPSGAGEPGGEGLPQGAFQLRNDAGQARYLGAAPPAGHGPHRYFVVVHALDVGSIGVPADGTASFLGFAMSTHTLARAWLVAYAETPG